MSVFVSAGTVFLTTYVSKSSIILSTAKGAKRAKICLLFCVLRDLCGEEMRTEFMTIYLRQRIEAVLMVSRRVFPCRERKKRAIVALCFQHRGDVAHQILQRHRLGASIMFLLLFHLSIVARTVSIAAASVGVFSNPPTRRTRAHWATNAGEFGVPA